MKNLKGLMAVALVVASLPTQAYGAGGVFFSGGGLRIWLREMWQSSVLFLGG